MKLEIGDRLIFKPSGYEVADIRNPNPPKTAEGVVNGKVELNHMVSGGGYVPLWVERENREPTTIYVCLSNIVRRENAKTFAEKMAERDNRINSQ